MPDDYTLNFNRIREQYLSKGLEDCLLKSAENLKEIHGVDYAETPGFDTLDDYNKKLYEKFLVKFYNGRQIDIRDKIKPTGIHYVQEIEYYVKNQNGDNICLGKTLTDYNTKENLYSSPVKLNEGNQGLEVKKRIEYFLRFDYIIGHIKKWLHVRE